MADATLTTTRQMSTSDLIMLIAEHRALMVRYDACYDAAVSTAGNDGDEMFKIAKPMQAPIEEALQRNMRVLLNHRPATIDEVRMKVALILESRAFEWGGPGMSWDCWIEALLPVDPAEATADEAIAA